MGAWNIDTFAVGDFPAIFDGTDDVLSFELRNCHFNETVIYQNRISDFHIFIEVVICDGNNLFISRNIFCCQSKFLTFFQLDAVMLEAADADFRSFCIKKRRDRFIMFLAELF